MYSKYIMQLATIARKKAQVVPFAVQCVIVIFASMVVFPPTSAIPQPVIISANVIGVTPVADFINSTSTPREGIAPLTVQFIDTSTGTPRLWDWDFGDTTYSSENLVQNPIHIYTKPGKFNVSLKVSSESGSSTTTKYNYINVMSSPAPPPPGNNGGGSDTPSTDKAGAEILSVPNLDLNLFAPPQEDVKASQSLDVSVPGITVDSSPTGQLTLTINRGETEKTGSVTWIENTVTITQPGFTLVIVVDQITEKNGIIMGENIASITLTTTPMEAVITSVGPVSASLEAGLSSLPEGATITTYLSDPVNPDILNAFGIAMTNEGKEILSVAYILTVDKTNIGTTLPATITMTCPPDWVNNHGGKEAVSIVRIGNDRKTQVLKTTFAGFDTQGRMIFKGYSPDGLSVFGLVTAKAAVVEQAENPNATVVVASKPAMSTNVGMYAWLVSTIEQNPVIMVIVLAAVALSAYFGWWKRRL